MDFDPRDFDDTRDRTEDLRDRDGDPRDVFARNLDLAQGREREIERDRGRKYTLRGSESRTLATVGAFRVVSSRDLRDHHDRRFWGESGDRLFWCLAAAFWIFVINYALVGLLPLADERMAYAFALRLVGFVAILVGVTLKDRGLADHLTQEAMED